MKVSELISALDAASSGQPNVHATVDAGAAFGVLAELLRSSGAQDLGDLRVTRKADDIASLILKFAEVSRFSKQQWIQLAETNSITLDLNPRDSARDVMGKLARYLQAHPDALRAPAATPKPGHQVAKPSKGRRKLAENLQETLTRLLDE